MGPPSPTPTPTPTQPQLLLLPRPNSRRTQLMDPQTTPPHRNPPHSVLLPRPQFQENCWAPPQPELIQTDALQNDCNFWGSVDIRGCPLLGRTGLSMVAGLSWGAGPS